MWPAVHGPWLFCVYVVRRRRAGAFRPLVGRDTEHGSFLSCPYLPRTAQNHHNQRCSKSSQTWTSTAWVHLGMFSTRRPSGRGQWASRWCPSRRLWPPPTTRTNYSLWTGRSLATWGIWIFGWESCASGRSCSWRCGWSCPRRAHYRLDCMHFD